VSTRYAAQKAKHGHDKEFENLYSHLDDDVRPPAGPGGRVHDRSRRTIMALFVIERNFAEQLDADGLDRAGIKLVNDDVGIRWVYSFLSADKKKTYCLYEAPNPEAILEAAARLGIPADVIVAVDQIEPVLAL
jgi:hypothetical protein